MDEILGTHTTRGDPDDKNPASEAGREGLGRSRGGLSTKIHLVAGGAAARWPDHHAGPARGRPNFIPLVGRAHIARRGQGGPRTRPGAALADKAYSPAANRACLRKRGIKAVIPVKEDQKAHRRRRGRSGGRPPAFDRTQYKDRNSAERCFTKLKQHRAVATGYDKRERIYQGTINVASIRSWLRDPGHDPRDRPQGRRSRA